ncbi:MAG: ATP-binding protein [Chloroflexota bacterium]
MAPGGTQPAQPHVNVASNAEERRHITALVAQIARALVGGGGVQEVLQSCAEAMVEHLDAAFARVWTYNAPAEMLELRASAGLYVHLDGDHSRVPLGELKIGLIAQERSPHLTNAVIGDPRVTEQEWARREGMVAFAGYPLLVEDRLVGVAALFARHPLSTGVLDALNSIADSIALGIERIEAQDELRASLDRESHARAMAEIEQSRAANLAEELLRAQAQKDDFLTAAAHDLKTPLTAVQGLAQLLLRRMDRSDELDPEQIRRGLEQITDASRRMAALINELLDQTHLQMGHPLALNRRSVELNDLVVRRIAMQPLHADRDRLRLHRSSMEIRGWWDADRIDRVISNLISNAVRYSDRGRPITMVVDREGNGVPGWARVAIRDEGIGIVPGEAERIFSRFYRGSNVPPGVQGTGIGLATARQIVEQHGGSLAVESELGKGSTFTVRLPL